jgi:large subunit ribosomal protein L24
MQRIRRDDLVRVLKGRERGKEGKVRRVIPSEDRAIIADVNTMKKHVKAGAQARQAGIIDIEAPIQLSNLALVCTKCHKPTRVGIRVLDNGTRARFCKKCGELI